MNYNRIKGVLGGWFTLLVAVSIHALGVACTEDFDVNGDIPAENNTLKDEEPEAVDTDTFVSYTYPTNDEVDYLDELTECNLKKSTQYEVYVKVGDADEIKLDVLMSDAIWWHYTDTDMLSEWSKGRTFSYVSVSFDPSKGEQLKFRVVPIGDVSSSSSAELVPRSYGYTAMPASDGGVEFVVPTNNKYISVNFTDSSNIKTLPAGTNKLAESLDWIKHMLLVSVDPMEVDAPKIGDDGVVDFATASDSQVSSAQVIYFRPGCYNFTEETDKSSCIRATYQGVNDGQLTIKPGQTVYIAGGAFVEGYIARTNLNDAHTVRGRGVLSGAQYTWQAPSYTSESVDSEGNITYTDDSKYQIMQMIYGGDYCVYEGIHVVDSPQHGMVADQSTACNNIKFLGWHCNNDGMRFGSGSLTKNCFIRACDDFFYNYNIDVEDCVLWPSYNGSIMTFGWNSIDLGGSCMKNIDIINCEWTNMGNNKGLVMSQNSAEFNIPDDGRRYTTFENIRIEGKIPGFINLKLGSNHINSTIDEADLGWLGNIRFKNVSIDYQMGDTENGYGANIIEGASGVVENNSSLIWEVRNIYFENVTIGGVLLSEENKDTYCTIDYDTTRNIFFE